MLGFMPVEFLTDVQAAAYSRFTQPPSLAELERFFFLDDTDMALVNKRRGDYNRLGFSFQLGTARLLGSFLADPLDVPTEAVDSLAEQLGVADPSCLKAYGEREKTRLEHQWEIAREFGYRDFPAVEAGSVISPIPAYSRTALMPDTAACLSGKDRETATTSPSGALSLNLKHMFSSMKSSNIPVMGVLLNAGRRPVFSGRVRDAALRSGCSGPAKGSSVSL